MNNRNIAIDVLRGLTMAVMVMVNDFWSYPGVPHFLEHYATMEDGMGLADFVYPLFLFVMGMSIPYALDRRRDKGESPWDSFRHILGRTFALLVMGVFLFNAGRPMAWNKGIYYLLTVAGFFLIWNSYKESFKPARWLKLAGVLILAALVVFYRTEKGGMFRTGWWGILGQIGWAYLFTSLAYMLCRKREWLLAVLWGALCLVNLSVVKMRGGSALIGQNVVAEFTDALHVGNGHIAIMALGGVLTVLAERRLKAHKALMGFGMAAVLALMGLATHQGWIISKNIGTLPWCLYVSAVGVAIYTLFRILEKHGLMGWAKPLGPAGSATLTVYMIPYLYSSLWYFITMPTPAWLCGWVGIVKSALLSALCIFITWCLGRLGIRLKI